MNGFNEYRKDASDYVCLSSKELFLSYTSFGSDMRKNIIKDKQKKHISFIDLANGIEQIFVNKLQKQF